MKILLLNHLILWGDYRTEVKVASQSDLSLANNRYDQTVSDRIAAEGALLKSNYTLRSLMSREFRALQPLQQAPVHPDRELEAVEAVQNNSPIVARLQAESKAGKADSEVARGQLYPQVQLRAERVANNLPTTFSDTRVLLALEYQSGAGLSGLSNYSAAVERSYAAQRDIERSRLDLEIRARNLVTDLQISTRQLQSLASLGENNREVVESYLRQFEAGRRPWLDVLNAQREYVAALNTLIDTRYAVLNAQLQLSLLSGQLPGAYRKVETAQ